MSDLPFPEAASTDTPYDEPAITSEQLLRKEVAQRFGSSGTYRDLPFAVLFLLQLCTVIVIALVNGLTLGQSSPPAVPGAPAPPASPPDVSGSDVARSHELLVMLMVASILSGRAAALTPRLFHVLASYLVSVTHPAPFPLLHFPPRPLTASPQGLDGSVASAAAGGRASLRLRRRGRRMRGRRGQRRLAPRAGAAPPPTPPPLSARGLRAR